MIFVLAGVSVVLFVMGVALFLGAYKGVPDPGHMVAKKEHENLKKELASTGEEAEGLKKQLDTLAVQLEETRGQLKTKEDQDKAYRTLKEQEKGCHDKIAQIEHDLSFLYTKADSQAQRAIEALEELKTDNDRLRQALEEAEKAVGPDEKLLAEQDALRRQIEENVGRIRELENELAKAQNQAEGPLKQAEAIIAELKQKDQSVRQGLKDVVGKIQELESAAGTVLRQKEEELQSVRGDVARLTAEAAHLADQAKANAGSIANLQQARPPASSPVVQSAAESPQTPAAGDVTALNQEIQRLKELNDVLTEKEEMMIFELTKSRAKIMGLEKMCHDLRASQSS